MFRYSLLLRQISQSPRRCLSSSLIQSLPPSFIVTQDIQSALANHEPIVALESTIVAHGMPYPTNYQVALAVEDIIRNAGVTPATIAIHQGSPHIGLSNHQLHDLANSSSSAKKCSTRELCILTAPSVSSITPSWGATTVASTMVLAHAVGIATFVTGGIGGVHRNGHVTMDISTDLQQLSNTPVVVVSAGIKSILDIAKTLQVLETLGVPVLSYQTSDMPAFFHPSSGLASPARVDTPTQVAQYYHAARALQLNHGMLVAVPNHHDAAGVEVEEAIQAALLELDTLQISGRDVTPFVLKRVAEQTSGASLQSNIALIQNNAKVGADIAIAIAEQQNQQPIILHAHQLGLEPTTNKSSSSSSTPSSVVVMGGAVVDRIAKPSSSLALYTSNPGTCTTSDGGVGRNIAEALSRLGTTVTFLTAIGNNDQDGRIVERLQCARHITTRVPHHQTATYLSILTDNGDLHAAVADMSVLSFIPAPAIEELQGVSFLLMDGNPSLFALNQAVKNASVTCTMVCLEPTSVSKARIVASDANLLSQIHYAFPNSDECLGMAKEIDTLLGDNLQEAASVVLQAMHPDHACLVVTLGQEGVLLGSKRKGKSTTFQSIPAEQNVIVLNSTGAGDSLCGGFLHALVAGKNELEAVQFGMKAAVLSLQCADRAVSLKLESLKFERDH